jgi:hypothetical protein
MMASVASVTIGSCFLSRRHEQGACRARASIAAATAAYRARSATGSWRQRVSKPNGTPAETPKSKSGTPSSAFAQPPVP